MKSPFNFSRAIAALIAAAACALPAISQAGSVVLNGTQVCTDSPNLSMDPSGNLQVTCTPIGGGGGTTFSCTLSPVVQSVTLGSTTAATITANCVNGTPPYTYSWSLTTAGGQAIDATTATAKTVSIPGPFNTAGSNTYALAASDSAATPATYNTSGTINVQAPGTCATTATNGAFTGFTGPTQSPLMPPGGYVAYSLPIFTTAQVGKMITISSVSASGSPAAINIQVSVSKCPGDFTADPACMMDGVTSTLRMNQYVGLAETPGNVPPKCTLAAGTQYYVSIRPVMKDHVTPSCTKQATCGAVVNYQIQH